MPRYYFDVTDGTEIRDEIGRELEEGSILRAETLQTAARLLIAEAEDSKETTLVLTVRDEANAIPLRVRLACQLENIRDDPQQAE
ncbi:DUF6894 family protein [Methylobacterium thuringiense]|uniref:DUF6894 family protein n=1 Tax=Methylobacterium thuringiense TaxID=1003091 RepID=UPI001EDE7FCF|nr:hypothetical protein [Methylobacterium thuringiense]